MKRVIFVSNKPFHFFHDDSPDKVKNFILKGLVENPVDENISDYKAKIYWALYRDIVQIAQYFVELL